MSRIYGRNALEKLEYRDAMFTQNINIIGMPAESLDCCRLFGNATNSVFSK